MAFLSRTEAVADGGTDTFAISFPYLDNAHVFVYTQSGGDPFVQYTEGFTFLSPQSVQLNTSPETGTVVQVRRETPCNSLLTMISAGSTLADSEINLVNTQLLYIIQENKDANPDALIPGILDILSKLRFTYDIALAGTSQFTVGDILGPVAITDPITLAVDFAGSRFAGPITDPTTPHTITIFKADSDGGNATALGTITVSTTGVVTTDATSLSTLVAGDIVYGQTTVAGGLQNFGITLRGFRL